MKKIKYSISITALAAVLLLVGVWVRAPRIVHAATTITVNSTADDASNDGECTLREAITAANSDTASGGASGECAAGSGTDTIAFNIAETADFTVTDRNSVVKNGYTITPTSALPDITQNVVINGYSQPGSLTNTAAAPLPLNNTILIEIDGQATTGQPGLVAAANGVEIRGLVVNNFEGNGISVSADNVVIRGAIWVPIPQG